MSHIYVEQGNIAELTNAKFLDNLKDTVNKDNLDNSSDLKGILQTAHIYDDTSKFFVTKYPRLSIICTNGQYIRFKDETLFDILMNNNIGDGVGITIEDAGNVTSWPTWSGANNTQTFETFDELKYFTRLTSIPQNKFANITTLKSIDLSNVTTINSAAFNTCTSLTYIDAHNATLINWGVFNRCASLLEADISGFIPTSSMSGNNMFDGCTSIKKIIVNPGLTDIPIGFVTSCNLLEEVENLDYNNITTIGSNAFSYCHTLFINMETFSNDKITVLNGRTFFDNHSIKNVNFPNCSTLLNNSGMWGGIFHNCYALKTAVFSSELKEIPDMCFNNSILESFDFSNITSISYSAFLSTKLTTVNAPKLTYLGGEAFSNCKQLTTVNAPLAERTEGTHIFNGCSALTTVILSSLASIPQSMFLSCTNLQNVTLASNVSSIGQFAFKSCSNLEHIYFDNYTGETIEGSAFEGCNKLVSLNLNGLKYIPGSLCNDCNALTSPGIDWTQIQTIGGAAFFGCKSLNEELILSSCTSIGDSAFCESAITKVDMRNVVTIGVNNYRGIFYNCKELTTVILNPSLTVLPPHMFHNCEKLMNVDVSNITEFQKGWGGQHFVNCKQLQSISFNSAVTFIPSFEGSYSLLEVTIPANVTEIETYAFKSCSSLTKVTILATTPPSIGHQETFQNANTDYPIYVPAESVESYKAADKWSYLASRIFAIPNS